MVSHKNIQANNIIVENLYLRVGCSVLIPVVVLEKLTPKSASIPPSHTVYVPTFTAVFLSACVKLWKFAIADFCWAVYAGGIVALAFAFCCRARGGRVRKGRRGSRVLKR